MRLSLASATPFSWRASTVPPMPSRQDVGSMETEFAHRLGEKLTSSAGIKGKLKLRDFSGV
jgi:hypothetical protein